MKQLNLQRRQFFQMMFTIITVIIVGNFVWNVLKQKNDNITPGKISSKFTISFTNGQISENQIQQVKQDLGNVLTLTANRNQGFVTTKEAFFSGNSNSANIQNTESKTSKVALSRFSLNRFISIPDLDRYPSNKLSANIARSVVLKCNEDRNLTIEQGTLYVRHNCPYKNINWGFKIATSIQASIITNVTETGMEWFKNGRRMPKNSPHRVNKSYFFHGTFSPVAAGDRIYFQDSMTFQMIVQGRRVNGNLLIYGEVNLVR